MLMQLNYILSIPINTINVFFKQMKNKLISIYIGETYEDIFIKSMT